MRQRFRKRPSASLLIAATGISTALLTSRPVVAASYTWTPPPDTDGNWFSTDNWTPHGPPASNLDFATLLASPTPIINGAAITGGALIGVSNLLLSADTNGNPYSLTSAGATTITTGGSVYVAGGYLQAGTPGTNFTIRNQIEISAGGQVDSYNAILSADPSGGASPKAVIRGVDTVWDATRIADDSGGTRSGRFLTVGDAVLELSNSATLYSENANLGSVNSDTLITVTNGALWDLTRPSAATTLGTFVVGGGPDGHTNIDVNTNGRIASLSASIGNRGTSTLTVGLDGHFDVSGTAVTQKTVIGNGNVNGGGIGILNIENGGAATGHNASLGEHAASSGTVNVTGSGSSWTLASAGTVTVGRLGAGTLNIKSGGHVTTGTLAIGGNSSVTATSVGGDGAVLVSGAGSLLSTVGFRVYVGTDGNGTLTIEKGGQFNGTSLAYVGNLGSAFSNNGHGTLLITDPGSSFTNSSDLRVANGGTVTLANGATASTFPGVQVGETNPARSSSVTVTGAGSTWNMGLLTLGGNAPASFSIFLGGHVTATSTVSVNSNGALTVNGAGSVFSGGQLSLSGELLVAFGGEFSSTGFSSLLAGGHARVAQPGSSWTGGYLTIGGANSASTGTVDLDDGSLSLGQDLRFASTSGARGTLVQSGGTLNVGTDPTTGGVVSFGPGISGYTLAGGTLNVKNKTISPTSNGLVANAATYTLTFAGGTLRATGNLTSALNATLAANTISTFDSNGFAISWTGSLTGPGQLRKTGAGSLSLTSATPLSSPLIVDGGTVNFSGGGNVSIPFLGGNGGSLSLNNTSLITTAQAGHTASLASLSLTNSTLDLSTGELSVSTAGTPTATLVNYIKSGALESSAIASTPNTTLGYLVDNGFTRIKFTYFGDLTLDGRVNADDFILLDRALAQGLPASWSTGDVNYDNAINAADFFLTDTAFAQQGGQLSPEFLATRHSQFGHAYVAELLTLAPEPSHLACLFAESLLLIRRRRAIPRAVEVAARRATEGGPEMPRRPFPTRLPAILLLAALAPSRASAGVWAPQPDGDSDWFNPDNWNPHGVPGVSTGVIIPSSVPPPSIDGNATCSVFTLDAPNMILALAPGNIPNTLSAAGDCTISATGSMRVFGGIFYAGIVNTSLSIKNSIEITAGGRVESYSAGVGSDPAFPGTASAVVRGSASVWDATVPYGAANTHPSHTLGIGSGSGQATFEISSGATVLSEQGAVSSSPDGESTVTVSTSGIWDMTRSSGGTNGGNFTVGSTGKGTVTINTAGRVAALNVLLGNTSTSEGKVVVSGTGLLTVSGTSTSQKTIVGYNGIGTLEIRSGATATGLNASVADQSLGSGSVVVDGPGSAWTLGNTGTVTIARSGPATLDITSGGHVSTGTLAIGGNTFLNGTSVGGTGTVTVSGTDSLLNVSGNRFYVGTDGTGYLVVSQGAHFTGSSLIYVGSETATSFSLNGHGGVTVTGPGSSFANTNALHLNNGAHFTVSDGASASTSGAFLGESSPTRTSIATVTGSSSAWTSGALSVGGSTPASVTVSDGAHLTSTTTTIGAFGSLTVTGPASLWNTSDTTVNGHVVISSGALVSSPGSLHHINAAGLLEVSGPSTSYSPFTLEIGTFASTSTPQLSFSDGSITLVSELRLTTVAGARAAVTQSGGTLTLGNGASGGFLTFGPGISAYTLAGGTLNARNKTSTATNGIVASASASYTFDLAGGTIRATGNLTSAVNANLVAGTTTTFDSNGFTFIWSGVLAGSGQLRKIGAGTLTLSSPTPLSAPLILEGGTVNFSGSPSVSIPFLGGNGTTSLSLSNTHLITTAQAGHAVSLASLALANSTLDLSTGELSVSTAGTPTATLVNYIKSGALESSAIASTPNTTLGYLLDNGFTRIKFTYFGDLTLDGRVNADDFILLDRALAQGLPASWSTGDVNYDNAINAADFLLADTAFAQQGGQLSPEFLSTRQAQFGGEYVATLLASVPEPTSAACGLSVPLLTRRRRP